MSVIYDNTLPFLDCHHFFRHLGKYEMSTMSLMTALNEKSNLEEKQVASVLKELTSSFSCDEYTQSRLELYMFGYLQLS